MNALRGEACPKINWPPEGFSWDDRASLDLSFSLDFSSSAVGGVYING